ncbi:hypothetical protein [Bradyrhizobium sp. 2S1]|uniref:hypothetical protein n=1 Tax=Bradyrhizobium sp. 2S1 TaxID=1404429 RepID=UPI001409343C|nr:hypothetical protein [Bradyrhizobium sp. 2S1]MCK7665009.1 hypothetical protein [Bradyrhizobium sp. 2S1]
MSDLSALPMSVKPAVFGQAMIEVLGFESVARKELADPAPTLDHFKSEAKASLTLTLASLHLSARLFDLANSMLLRHYNEAKATPGSPAQQITNVLLGMITEMGNWFSLSQVLTTAKYRSRIRILTFAVGFGLAAVLDLQPVPIGGSATGGKFPYGVAIFEWLVVAASTLWGAPFWYEILKKIAPDIVGAADIRPAGPETAEPARALRG